MKEKFRILFPFRFGNRDNDSEEITIISINGADYVVNSDELESIKKEKLSDFILRLESSISELEKNHKTHLKSVKDLIVELKSL